MKIEIKVSAIIDDNDNFTGYYDIEISDSDTMNSDLFDMLVEDFPNLKKAITQPII